MLIGGSLGRKESVSSSSSGLSDKLRGFIVSSAHNFFSTRYRFTNNFKSLLLLCTVCMIKNVIFVSSIQSSWDFMIEVIICCLNDLLAGCVAVIHSNLITFVMKVCDRSHVRVITINGLLFCLGHFFKFVRNIQIPLLTGLVLDSHTLITHKLILLHPFLFLFVQKDQDERLHEW